jgi:hypothetical protein
MAQDEIHVGDIGTRFVVSISDGGVPVSLTSATVKQIIFLKPDQTKLSKTAAFVTDGADGQLVYVSENGDLSLEGVWKIQARVVLPSGEWRSDVQTFTVYSNL